MVRTVSDEDLEDLKQQGAKIQRFKEPPAEKPQLPASPKPKSNTDTQYMRSLINGLREDLKRVVQSRDLEFAEFKKAIAAAMTRKVEVNVSPAKVEVNFDIEKLIGEVGKKLEGIHDRPTYEFTIERNATGQIASIKAVPQKVSK